MRVVRGFLLCLQTLQFVDVQASERCFFRRNLYCTERCCGGISKEYCCPHPSEESSSSTDNVVIVVVIVIIPLTVIGLGLCVVIVCACRSYWKRKGCAGGQVHPQGQGPDSPPQGPQTQPALPYGIRPVSGMPAFGIHPPAYDDVPPRGPPQHPHSKATHDPPPPYSHSDPGILPGCVPEATTAAAAEPSPSPPPYRDNSRPSTVAGARSP